MKKTTIIIDKKNSFLNLETASIYLWLSFLLTEITDNYIQNNILTFFSILICYILLLIGIFYSIKFIKNKKNISYYYNVSNKDADYIADYIEYLLDIKENDQKLYELFFNKK